jgi:hypothetical protein
MNGIVQHRKFSILAELTAIELAKVAALWLVQFAVSQA